MMIFRFFGMRKLTSILAGGWLQDKQGVKEELRSKSQKRIMRKKKMWRGRPQKVKVVKEDAKEREFSRRKFWRRQFWRRTFWRKKLLRRRFWRRGGWRHHWLVAALLLHPLSHSSGKNFAKSFLWKILNPAFSITLSELQFVKRNLSSSFHLFWWWKFFLSSLSAVSFSFFYLFLRRKLFLSFPFSCEFYTPLSSFEAKSTPRSELGLLAGDLGLPRLADWGGVQVIPPWWWWWWWSWWSWWWSWWSWWSWWWRSLWCSQNICPEASSKFWRFIWTMFIEHRTVVWATFCKMLTDEKYLWAKIDWNGPKMTQK